MLRLIAFFAGVVVLLNLLQAVPVLGGIFHGFLGFWVTAILLSIALSRLTGWTVQRARFARQVRSLGHVESAHNQGKIGALLLVSGQHARALAHLDNATAGEPGNADWHFRRGCALLELGRHAEAAEALRRAVAIAPGHAYGEAQLRLSEALLRQGDAEGALAAIAHFEDDHGSSPESAFRRALALKKLGRREEAGASLKQVGDLAAKIPAYQRGQARRWLWRSWLARIA